MKKLFILFALLLIAMAGWTQTSSVQQNPKLSYQAVVRDNSNKLVVDQNVKVTINILNQDGTVSQYGQTFESVQTNRNGLVSLLIGGNENWDNVVWPNAKIRVAVEIPSAGCTVVDTTDVSASPLAIYAQNVNLNAIPQSDWKQTSTDAPDYIKNKPDVSVRALCDSVKDCTNDLIQAATDTLISNRELEARGYLTSDSALIVRMRDSIQINNNAIQSLQEKSHTHYNFNLLETYTQTEANLADAVSKKHTHSNKAVLDRTDRAYREADSTKLAGIAAGAEVNVQSDWNQTSPEADDYIKNKPSLDTMASVANLNALAGRVTTAESNIVTANNSIQTNKEAIQSLQNDSHTHDNKAVLDRTDRAYREADSTKLDGIAAGAEVNVQADWDETNIDTAAYIKNKPTIPAAANNATITIKKNNETVGSFTLDQNTDSDINIEVPTAVSQLSDANNYVTTGTEQTISGNKSFTGSVIVPSGFNLDTTTSVNCNNLAVNACDLLTVFDSIQRQFTALRTEIDGLRDSLKDLRSASEPEFTRMDFERAENSLTATATFNDHGATITEYEFCISTSQEMTDPTCQTTTDANYTFSDLNPGTQYYVTVAATNLKGTTTSDAQGVQTVHAKPVLGVPTATAVSNTEIKVEGELTSMGGSTPTTVTVKAYTSDNHSGDEPVASANTELSAIGNYTLNITGLNKYTQYFLDVIADNGEKKDTAKTSATTLNITVTVTSDPATDTIRTGSNVDVTVKYTAAVSGIDAAEDGYSWKVNNTDSTSTSNELTVHYTEAGAYTVVCAYNDATDTAVTVVVVCDTITFVPNGGFGEMDKQIVERGKATNLTTNTFTHEGWTFKGWSNDCDHIVTYEGSNRTLSYTDGASITTERNVKLYAVWATSCTGIKGSNETGENGKVFSVNDVCNNDYAVVQIGSQCWMKEDLRTTKLVDRTELENGTHYELNDNGTMSYSNSILDNICPAGWHVPSKDEWNQLFDYIKNDESLRCGDDMYLKALATPCGWISTQPNTCGICDELESNNKSGFSMFPQYDPEPNYVHSLSYYWTNTKNGSDNYMWTITGSNGSCNANPLSQLAPLIRCLRNESLGAVTKTDSTAHSLTVSADCALENVTTATVCAYTDAECNTEAACAETVNTTSPITAIINGLNANTSYYVKVTVTTAEGSVSRIGGPFKTATQDTITFIANGGTGSMQKQIVERGVSTPISTNSYQHGGNWQFIGWNDACDGKGNSYTNEANITTNGNVTLHAQWHTWCSGVVTENESGNNRIDSVRDHEDNWYDVVQIGTQCWLKENMRAGSLMSNPSTNIVVATPSSCGANGACYYDGDINNYKKYGYLYGSSAASNICPNGWHLPSYLEWKKLIYDIVGVSEALDWDVNIGEGLGKLAGGCDWVPTDNKPTSPSDYSYNYRNNTGFTALPGGCEFSGGGIAPVTLYENSYFWATGEYDIVSFYHNLADAYFDNNSSYGNIFLQSVRCVRDVSSECENIVTEEDIEIHGFPYVYNNDTTFSIGTEDGDYILHRTSTEGCSKTTTLHVKVTCGNNIKDHEGNEYATTYINGVCIMAQNLRCTSSPNGHTLTQWAWCDDYSCGGKTDASLYSKIESLSSEGYLYNWRAAMDTTIDVASIGTEDFSNHRGLCPAGWHLPTKSEWETVVGSIDAGQFAKENSSWYASDVENTPGYTSDPDKNATGFSAIPAGWRYGNTSEASNLGYEANFWSASSFKTSEYNSEYDVIIPFDLAYVRKLEYNNSIFYEPTFGTSETPNVENFYKSYGASVRCVRNADN